MKKKALFFIFALLTFTCVLVISASAAVTGVASDEFGEVTVVDGLTTKSTDLTAKVVLKNEDNTFSTYYTYYIYPKFNWRGGMSQPDFTGLNKALETSYDANSIIRIELLSDCKHIELPGECNTYLKELLIPEDIDTTTLNRTYFTALEKVNIPSKITTLGTNTFHGTSTLKYVTFGKDFAMTSLPNSMFAGCSSLEEIRLPNSITSIGSSVFSECTSLKKLYLGENLDKIGTSIIVGTSNLKIYASSAWFTTNAPVSNSFAYAGHTPTDVTLYYVGTKEEAEALMAKSKHNGIKNATLVKYDPTKSDEYFANPTQTAWTIVYDYNKCNAFYNREHENDINPCVINCDRCKTYGVAKENPIHNLASQVKYSSFTETGLYIVGCTNEGCTHAVTEELETLFTCLGYSVTENGYSNVFSIGYAANNIAIDKYKELSGNDLSYGVFAVLKDKLGDNDIFSANGKADGVLSNDLTARRFDIFEFKISGFDDSQMDTKLALGAFVITSNQEKTEYSYLQIGTKAENEKYVFVSYYELTKSN